MEWFGLFGSKLYVLGCMVGVLPMTERYARLAQ